MSVNVERVANCVARLGLLKFFPSEPIARTELVSMVIRMAQDERQIEWLIERALQCFDEWPGPKKLRALYCRRWKPADGIEAFTSDDERERWENLPEPPTPWEQRLEAPKQPLRLPKPMDEKAAEVIEILAQHTKIPDTAKLSFTERKRMAEFNLVLEAILTPPNERKDPPMPSESTPQVITQADIEEAVRIYRESKATA